MSLAFMNTGKLKISASIDYDGDCVYDVTITKENIQVQVHFWWESHAFNKFGEDLVVFPHTKDDVVEFELGTITLGTCQDYLLLKAFCYDANGHAALKVIMHNNELEPRALKMEFTIPAEIAALNKLGILLRNWQPEADSEIIWTAQVS